MDKVYLFIFDNNVGTREEIIDVLNTMQLVTNWRYDIPHTFYVISAYSAQELYDEFIANNGVKGRFMFMEAADNRQGQMLSDTWYLLTNKSHKPKE